MLEVVYAKRIEIMHVPLSFRERKRKVFQLFLLLDVPKSLHVWPEMKLANCEKDPLFGWVILLERPVHENKQQQFVALYSHTGCSS